MKEYFLWGGGRFAISIGKLLKEEGFRVVFVDTNESNIRRVRNAGLEAHQGNVFFERVQEEVGLEGLGNLLAFTPNDEANSLAAVEFKHIFGARHVFQLASLKIGGSILGGRIFANQLLSTDKIEELWGQGYRPFLRELPRENISEDSPPEPSLIIETEEYILAEIESGKLYILADDNLMRAARPEKQIVFGLRAIESC